MADESDMEALLSGDSDLVRRDFRGATMSGLTLPGRDFTGADLRDCTANQTDFSRSVFKQAKFMRMVAKDARFVAADLSVTALSSIDFSGSDLSLANLQGSHLARCNLSNVDLRGANLSKAHINEGTTFASAIVDETTRFDGASVFRPISKQEAFRYYRVERGVLVRRTEQQIETLSHPTVGDNLPGLVEAIDEALDALSTVAPRDDAEQPIAGIGHNRPPSSAPLTRSEYDELRDDLVRLRQEHLGAQPDISLTASLGERLEQVGEKIAAWAHSRFQLIEEEFFKGIGKTLSDGKTILGAWLILSGKLEAITTIIAASLS